MVKLLSFLYIFLCLTLDCLSQDNYGPRLTAMGLNGAAVADTWSGQANSAGITGTKSPTAAINYAKYLYDTELSQQGLVFILPIGNNFVGLGLQRYGINAYNEIKGTLTLSKKFGDQLSIGMNANYHQLKINNYGSTTTFSLDLGILFNCSSNLILGLYLKNPSLQEFSHTNVAAKIPTSLNLGTSYKLSSKILVATTIKKEIEQKIDVAFGIDYKIFSLLSLRGGITAKPFKQFMGLALNYKLLLFDIAFEKDPNLGYIPQIALCYAF